MSDRRLFREACHEAAGRTGGKIMEFRFADSVTPNFHQAVIVYDGRTVAVAYTRDPALVAIIEPRVIEPIGGWDCGPLTFLDAPELLTVLAARFPVLTPADLTGPFDPSLWPHIDAEDIKYWKPNTLGEALFNYWD